MWSTLFVPTRQPSEYNKNKQLLVLVLLLSLSLTDTLCLSVYTGLYILNQRTQLTTQQLNKWHTNNQDWTTVYRDEIKSTPT
jgi:hypothetical protein